MFATTDTSSLVLFLIRLRPFPCPSSAAANLVFLQHLLRTTDPLAVVDCVNSIPAGMTLTSGQVSHKSPCELVGSVVA